jgi:hypothetical protein
MESKVFKKYKRHKKEDTRTPFLKLSDEVLLLIFSYLAPKSLNDVGCVNKHFRAICTDDTSKIQANSLFYLLKNKAPNHLNEIEKLALVFIKSENTITEQGKVIEYIHEHLEDFKIFFLDLRIALRNPSYEIIAVPQNNHQKHNIRCEDNYDLMCFYMCLPPIFTTFAFIGAMAALLANHWSLFYVLLPLSIVSVFCWPCSFPLGLLLLKATELLLNGLRQCCTPKVIYEKKIVNKESVWRKFVWELQSKSFSEKEANLGTHRNNFYNEYSTGDIEANLEEDTPLIPISASHKHYYSLTK